MAIEPIVLTWALEAFTDAGRSADSPGNGTGGVLGDWWFYVPWSVRVRAWGWRVDGMKVIWYEGHLPRDIWRTTNEPPHLTSTYFVSNFLRDHFTKSDQLT